MKHKIVLVLITLLGIITMLSCSNNKIGTSKSIIDSSLYITEDIKLYDSLDTLLKAGVIFPSVTGASKYVAKNLYYQGFPFNEVGINYSKENTDSLLDIAYGAYLLKDSIQPLYNLFYQKLLIKYGKPNKERVADMPTVPRTNAVWYKKKMVVLLSSFIDPEGDHGTLIIAFMAPKDTSYFSPLME